MKSAHVFFLSGLVAISLVSNVNISSADPSIPIYRDPTASLTARVNDAFSRLTEKDKLSLFTGTTMTTQPIATLGLPGISFADAGQGVRGGPPSTCGPATAFPAGTNMASSWDEKLLQSIGRAIGNEALNKGTGTQIELAPAVNIHRSPLCGRDSEYMSEDPYLNARLGVAYIDGMQSTGVGACVKHFACNNEEFDRGYVNVVVDERTLREIYLPAFEAAVKQAHVRSIMAAYNKVNGPYCTANWPLLTNILRDDWGFDGLVVSDWGAVHEVSGVINGGTDIEMPGPGDLTAENLQRALENGTIKQATIDRDAKDMLRAMIRSGLADPVRHVPDPSVVGNKDQLNVAYRGAVEGMVLLKNNNNLLPINPNATQKIAILGPRAASWQIEGDGSPNVDPLQLINATDGITQRVAGTNTTLIFPAGDDLAAAPIRSSALTADDGVTSGLTAAYFNNMTLAGPPVATRVDPDVQFTFNSTNRPSNVQAEQFSARWTGTITAPETGNYDFSVTVDDGCRLFIDNKLVIDAWNEGSSRPVNGHIALVAGQKYPIKLEFFQDRADAVCDLNWHTPSSGGTAFQYEVDAAKQADIAIVVVGSEHETEGADRTSMDLPDEQDLLIKKVVEANPHTLVVLNNGGPVLVKSWIDSVPAVLKAGFPGELGGKALAAVLFGDEDPSGKLVDTYGVRREDYPDYGHFPGVKGTVHYTEGIYVGYRAFDKRKITPMYPFGYGLSYTQFHYSNLKISNPSWNTSGTVTVTADITNTGKVAGAEVAELYIEPKAPLIDRPIRELKGFDRVDLLPGQSKEATFTLRQRDFAYCDVPGKQWRADKGSYVVEVGSSSRTLLLESPIHLVKTWTDPIHGIGAKNPYTIKPSLSYNRPSTASSVKHDNDAAYAFDNDPSTRWESEWSDPQWLAVDLGKPTWISKVQLSWEAAFASSYQIQVSNDQHNWKTVYSTTNGKGSFETVTFSPVEARYVRIYCTARGTKFGSSLFSFDIFKK